MVAKFKFKLFGIMKWSISSRDIVIKKKEKTHIKARLKVGLFSEKYLFEKIFNTKIKPTIISISG